MAATLESRFPMIIAELRPRVSAAVKAGAELIAADAKVKAPIGPGNVHIREHFKVEREGPAEYTVLNDAQAESGRHRFPYAKIVEFGGANSAPQPFLIPAAEENRDNVAALVMAVLRSL